MNFNLPIEIGQKFRKMIIENFRSIDYAYRNLSDVIYKHKNLDKHAHDASQIDYADTSVDKHLKYQNKRISRLVLGHNGDGIQELTDSRVAIDGEPFNVLSERLYYDFNKINKTMEDNYNSLNKKIERIINVNDYGADPTGEKDSTEAFKKAFANGGKHVHMTEGIYIVTGLKLPNNTILSGEGKTSTTIKLSDDAPNDAIVVTNLDMSGNAENIGIEGFKVDGNRTRQGGELKPAGGSLSSGVRFAGVKNSFMKSIKTVDTLLHGIDITYASDPYSYAGDGVRVSRELESEYVWIDDCEATRFGDDGITTHHSRYLYISNSYAHHPFKKGGGNNNGIEVDDASQYVFLHNNRTEENFGGLEIKGHQTTSAASHVFVNQHISINDNRSYNIRHIGHHVAKDIKSKTAEDIVLNNCVAVTPYKNEVYPGSTPRAMVISAYRNVQINNFTAIGDGTFQAGMPVIAIQYRSENVTFNGLNIRGFKNASTDVQIFGGANRPKKITISNFNIIDSSANQGITNGSSVYDTKIIGGNMQGQGTGTAIFSYNNNTEIIGVNAEGYTNQAKLAGRLYKTMPTVVKGGLSAGITGGGAIAQRSAAIASTGGSYAHSDRSWIAGVGAGSQAHGSRSAVVNSLESETLPGSYCQTIFNSRGVKSRGNYSFLMGYGQNGARYSNTTIDMSSTSGNIKTKGTVSSGQNFGDYAEYFESQSGQEIPNGYIVTLDGRYIRKANGKDKPIGVISGTAGVILADQMFHHKNKFLKDEFGVTQTETELKEWQDDEGNWYSEEVEVPIPNPDFDEIEDAYVPRSERPEWNVVGLVGQVFTRIDSTVSVNDYIKPQKGIGTKDNNEGYYRVLEITTPYNTEKGYGVAVVLVK
ncbi:peptidase G2 autoproteolytic cleavage domain-containing protein [Mammaliicoccus lentus]|uniref:peptidase G2 autoproteolytic cleavage domain-containing protein n=1 Tax=Mammaliicoccus lentus TaxID=42858 RepID=UPI0010720321|nr:peptidase G2 autoproteolytic cleavage domain-containing protein [Mammaliicoccus lentus]MBF0749308.1 peptidase G2 [Mammaliicoccus lentus]TFU57979.1 peptidase G2 [Mammaliicoccus lentus]